MKRICLAALALLALCGAASAQAPVKPCLDTTNTTLGTHDCQPVAATNPLPTAICLNGSGQTVPCATSNNGNGPVLLVNPGNLYPASSTPVTASATGTTAATTATLPANVAQNTYLCGFSINSAATTAAAGNATITGVTGGTLNYEMGTGTAPAVVITSQSYNPCLRSSAINTPIVVTSAAPGAGGVISVTASGYQGP